MFRKEGVSKIDYQLLIDIQLIACINRRGRELDSRVLVGCLRELRTNSALLTQKAKEYGITEEKLLNLFGG